MTTARKKPVAANLETRNRVITSNARMSARFVISKTVTSNRSGVFNNRSSRTAAGRFNFT